MAKSAAFNCLPLISQPMVQQARKQRATSIAHACLHTCTSPTYNLLAVSDFLSCQSGLSTKKSAKRPTLLTSSTYLPSPRSWLCELALVFFSLRRASKTFFPMRSFRCVSAARTSRRCQSFLEASQKPR
eukprot:6214541-Pleurochrysis_carterae.AAC.1